MHTITTTIHTKGMWAKGRPHGPGRYVWAAGPEYDGEWVSGAMHGKGTLKVCCALYACT